MRTLQSTAVSYGLQNIPVRLATAVRDTGTGLNNACPNCKGDMGLKNVCKECNSEVEYANVLKALKVGDQKYVFTKEQIAEIKKTDSILNVLGTIPKDQIDIKTITGSYYVLPDKKIQKAWGILQHGLTVSDRVIVVSFSIRSKQRLGILYPQHKYIVLLGIAYNEQVVEMDEDVDVKVAEQEVQMGKDFVQSLKTVELSTIKDDFNEKLAQLMKGEPITIESKPAKDELAFFKAS